MWVAKRLLLAHRVYYEREYGPITPRLQLDHLCRVPECVRPDHQEPVTNQENSRRGAQTKLTPEIADDIRERYATGAYTQRQLATLFGVGKSTVAEVTARKRWS